MTTLRRYPEHEGDEHPERTIILVEPEPDPRLDDRHDWIDRLTTPQKTFAARSIRLSLDGQSDEEIDYRYGGRRFGLRDRTREEWLASDGGS